MMNWRFAERARLNGGSVRSAIEIPAEVLRVRGGSVSVDEQGVEAGGALTIILRNSDTLAAFCANPGGVQLELLRWRKGNIYNVDSAEPEHGGRFLRVTARRTN